MSKLILFYCSLLFIPFPLNSQDYHAKTLTAENGLPSEQIYCAIEDSKGFIWIGTKNGVARWDSKNFEYFTIKDGLPNNEVTGIFEDTKGRIWFSTFSNKVSYFFKDKIINEKINSQLINIKLLSNSTFYEFKNELYYINSNSCWSKFSLDTFVVTNFSKNRNNSFYYFFIKKPYIPDFVKYNLFQFTSVR